MSIPVLVGLIVLGVSSGIIAITAFSDSSEKAAKKHESVSDYPSATSEQWNRIKSALGEGYRVHECRVIPSDGKHLGYWVGARFTWHEDKEGVAGKSRKQIGIWFMMGEKDDPRGLYSVDNVAFENSRMGKAEFTKLGYSMRDWEAQELLRDLSE